MSALPQVTAQVHPRIPPVRVFHFFDDEEMERLPEPDWRIASILPDAALTVLFGPSGVGKSFLSLDWALSIQTGRPWLGRETVQGDVVYVAAEGSAGIGRRLRAWKAAHGASGLLGARFLPHPVQLRTSADVTGFVGELLGFGDRRPSLVVVDTLARCFVGGDENSAKDMGVLVDAAERIRRETGAGVLLVHHTGKSGLEERGSSALRGAADTMLSLSEKSGNLTLRCVKQKDAEPFGPVPLRLSRHIDSCTLEPATAGAPTRFLEGKGRECLQALLSTGGGGGLRAGTWEKASGLSPTTFHRYRDELVSGGLVAHDGTVYRLTDEGREALSRAPGTPTPKPLPGHSHGSFQLYFHSLPHPVGVGVGVDGGS